MRIFDRKPVRLIHYVDRDGEILCGRALRDSRGRRTNDRHEVTCKACRRKMVDLAAKALPLLRLPEVGPDLESCLMNLLDRIDEMAKWRQWEIAKGHATEVPEVAVDSPSVKPSDGLT